MTQEEEICAKCPLHDKFCGYALRGLVSECSTFNYLELKDAARRLVEAVEQYVEPKPGKYADLVEVADQQIIDEI